MKLQSLNYTRQQNVNTEHGKTKGKNPSFGNPAVGFATFIENNGFLGEFLSIDTFGMMAPRTAQGYLRNREELGHINYKAGREELIRELLSGPAFFYVPLTVMTAVGLLRGKVAKVQASVLDSFKPIMQKTTASIKDSAAIKKDFVKSFIGIFTGKFENIEQINIATGNGGIVDTISDGLDYSLEKIYDKGYINNTIFSIIKSGKNALLNTIEGNLNKELENQTNIFNQLNTNISEWKEAYNNKNWNLMNKIYENIENNIDKIIPLENLIKEIRKIEDIQNFIKNKGENYEISELEKELIEKFSEIK